MSLLIRDTVTQKWSGKCPRCGEGGFFETKHGFNTGAKEVLVLWCHGQHAVLAETLTGDHAESFPVEFHGEAPSWLPLELKGLYTEALKALAEKMFSSTCALCGILLEVRVNELIQAYLGDNPNQISRPEKIPLHKKLEFLIEKERISPEQFSSAIIAKLARNEALHPSELENISRDDAQNALDAVTSFLEREFKFSFSKALPGQ